MPKIVKNGITYTKDASALTTGSTTVTSTNAGVLETKASYVRGNISAPTVPVEGTFMIFSGTADPTTDATLQALGKNGDIYLKRVS